MEPRAGRPRASSREILAEAACELFLEQGYEATSVADITTRAGVSRSSFFNYYSSKADVLWAGLDERIEQFQTRLDDDRAADASDAVVSGLTELGNRFAPDSLALALVNAEAMGLVGELERDAAVRQARIGRICAARLRRGGADALTADVQGAACGGAVLAALRAWAGAGAGRTVLGDVLARALTIAASRHRLA